MKEERERERDVEGEEIEGRCVSVWMFSMKKKRQIRDNGRDSS